MSFESAVANNEEYFDYEGVELRREIRCSGCDETLEFGSDYSAHTASCTFEPDAEEPTYEVSADALYEQAMEPEDDGEDLRYEAHKDWLRENR